MRRSLALALLASLPLVGACASVSGNGGSGDPAASGGTSQADDDLLVRVDLGDGSAPEEWTLSCAGDVSGTHPEAKAACTHLAGMDDPFAPIPDDVACTEQFGGLQTARVTGRWGGELVDLEFARSNGCLISQWDATGPLLRQSAGAGDGRMPPSAPPT